MAITRSQQAKQMLQDGGMLVKLREDGKRPGYATADEGHENDPGFGSNAPGPGDGDNRSDFMGDKGKKGPPAPAYDEFTPPSKRNFDFMKDARRAVNPLGFLTELPGTIGFVSRALTPNPFGFENLEEEEDDKGEGETIPSIFLANSQFAQAPSTMEQEPEQSFEFQRRFRADGGIMNSDVVGGEYDFETARQAYGIGKLVRKVTRTVKKIAKSPIGKAAIIGGLGYLGLTKTGFGTGLMESFSALSPIKKAGIIGGGLLTAAPFFMKPEEEEEEDEEFRGEKLDIAGIRANPNQFLARRFRAEGGSMKEPVAKKTMPLLDMDGKEMDLRAEGGFVPIGRMEKADDVPARLSKNEFVFTADAVRNAGEGNVDKGAEVMYNMMKNLESGGEVSEESQGLEGARKMFQTSQRLEEVL